MRISLVLFIVSCVMFACLCAAAHKVRPYIITNHLAAIPKAAGEKTVSVKAADSINERITLIGDANDKLMLTYISSYDSWGKGALQTKDIKLHATNYTYPFVLGYPITDGSFFKEGARNSAALNKKAAFDLYGSVNAAGERIDINSNPFIITGVIDDGDDKSRNAYISAESLDEPYVTGVMVSLSGDTSSVLAKDALRQAQIDESGFFLLDLGRIAAVVRDKVYLCAYLAGIGFLILIFKQSMLFLFARARVLKNLSRDEYLKGIFMRGGGAVGMFISAIILCVFIIAGVLYLLPLAADKFLEINSVKGIFDGVILSSFYTWISALQGLYQLSNVFFIVFAAAFLGFVTAWVKTSGL